MTVQKFVSVIGMVVALAGCGGNGAPGGLAGAPAAPAAVERFLQLADARDYGAMGWVFGTASGPIAERDPMPEVEQRMYALSQVLQHDGFVVGSGIPVPGRSSAAALAFDVIINQGRQTYRVPVTAVAGPGRRWFVEQIDVEAITDQ